MLSVLLTSVIALHPNIEIIRMPAERLPCGHPGWVLREANGAETEIVRAQYAPDGLAIQVWPAVEGRVFCNGFES